MSTESPASQSLLLSMHNSGLVGPRSARSISDLGSLLNISIDEARIILAGYEKDGYVASYSDAEHTKKYYLTGKGILKVSSAFT